MMKTKKERSKLLEIRKARLNNKKIMKNNKAI